MDAQWFNEHHIEWTKQHLFAELNNFADPDEDLKKIGMSDDDVKNFRLWQKGFNKK